MFLSTEIHEIGDLLLPEVRTLTRNGRDGKVEYLDLACAFDIETTSWREDGAKRATMYAYGLGVEGRVKIGRTWGEFLRDLDALVRQYGLGPTRRMIVYVHNLSYEFQWIRKRLEWERVFALSAREVVYAVTTQGIEFRCSYVLSNRSLDQVGRNLTLHKVSKLVGDLDYDLPRNSRTPLSDLEVGYLRNDCLVVMAYVDELRQREGNLLRIPLTNTGFVRGHCRTLTVAPRENWRYRKLMSELTMDEDLYAMMRLCFMGGFTHANSLWSGGIEEGVASYDLTSSYPTVMCSEMFPMSRPREVRVEDREGLRTLCRRFCVCMDVTLEDLSERFPFDHYLSRSRCVESEGAVTDNGRIVSARRVRLVMTERDLDIVERTYGWSRMTVNRCLVFRKAYLPREFVSCILDFYGDKTKLKGVAGMETEYEKKKNMINSCYGMCVTDPCRDIIDYDGTIWTVSGADVASSLERYNRSPNRFLYYPWGVWVTAHARHNLWEAILSCGRDYVYSDTDSVKILNEDRHRAFFEDYDRRVVARIDACLRSCGIDPERSRPRNVDGVPKQMGVWDREGRYDLFKTIGAKRYATVSDGRLSITVAGVSKSKGAEYLVDRFGSAREAIRNFDDGLVFPARYVRRDGKEMDGSGKMTHTYIDGETHGTLVDWMGNVAEYDELSSVHLEPTSYDLSVSGAYRDFLEGRRGNWQWKR